MPKRARDDTEENKNEELATAFETLMMYEAKGGSKWASVAYNKVVKGIREFKKPITKGADVSHLPGFGKAAVKKIDEYLTSGGLKKIDEFKETFGPLPTGMKSIGKSATAKSAPKGTTAAAGGKTKAKKRKVITAAQLKKIKQEEEAYSGYSVDKLKNLLKANGQTTTGAKADLVERCAQGKVLGRIPLCPLCCAGKLRFDSKSGEYSCPGYMDDDTFAPCFFKSDTVDRTSWNEV